MGCEPSSAPTGLCGSSWRYHPSSSSGASPSLAMSAVLARAWPRDQRRGGSPGELWSFTVLGSILKACAATDTTARCPRLADGNRAPDGIKSATSKLCLCPATESVHGGALHPRRSPLPRCPSGTALAAAADSAVEHLPVCSGQKRQHDPAPPDLCSSSRGSSLGCWFLGGGSVKM